MEPQSWGGKTFASLCAASFSLCGFTIPLLTRFVPPDMITLMSKTPGRGIRYNQVSFKIFEVSVIAL